MGSRRTAPRAPSASAPVDQRGLEAAVQLFTGRFVVAAKQRQIGQRLSTAARRAETLATLARWLGGAPTPLTGADQSPAGLEARFGAMPGVYLDGAGARRTSVAGALELGRGQDALFIGDTGRLALLAQADGPTLLCMRL
ncbi:MAG: hypothetical protein IPL61_27125 [Myxococcales bacterium]|nr:hypothetical protein [Myxococcales bacterium]